MNTFNRILLTLLFTIFSSSAFAVANATYEKVWVAIESTITKVEEAKNALKNGTDKDALIDMVSEARQLQKDIANNDLDVKRNRASAKLKKARRAIKKDELESAHVLLVDALNRYQEIKQLYAASH